MKIDFSDCKETRAEDYITFGKYRGRFYGDIARIDPGYLCWVKATLNHIHYEESLQDYIEKGEKTLALFMFKGVLNSWSGIKAVVLEESRRNKNRKDYNAKKKPFNLEKEIGFDISEEIY